MANSQDGSAGEVNAERAAVARTTAKLLSAVNAADRSPHPRSTYREIPRSSESSTRRRHVPLMVGQRFKTLARDFMSIRREPTGAWKLAMDIWNSDTPVTAEPSGRRR